jgi:hypothetical protein
VGEHVCQLGSAARFPGPVQTPAERKPGLLEAFQSGIETGVSPVGLKTIRVGFDRRQVSFVGFLKAKLDRKEVSLEQPSLDGIFNGQLGLLIQLAQLFLIQQRNRFLNFALHKEPFGLPVEFRVLARLGFGQLLGGFFSRRFGLVAFLLQAGLFCRECRCVSLMCVFCCL